MSSHTPSIARERLRLAYLRPAVRAVAGHLARLDPRSRRAVLALALALALGAPALYWLWPRTGETALTRPSRPATREARVERRDVDDVFLLTGEVRAVRSLEVTTPQTAAWQLQIKWLAEDGAEVRVGDPVVEFDSSSLVQNLEETRLRLTQAEIERAGRERTVGAEHEKRRVAVTLAETELEKARLEAEVPQSLRSRREWHQKQAELHERQAQLERARSDLTTFAATSRAERENARLAQEKAARALEQGERTLSLLSVRAPRAGIFLVAQHWQRWAEDRKLQVGDMTMPGTVVASIPDLGEMEVVALLPAVDEGAIAAGASARAILDAYPAQVFEGRVAQVASVAQEQRDRGGFDVRVTLGRVEARLVRPGMSVRIEVVRRRWKQALAVPRGAVEWDGAKTLVSRPGGGQSEVQLEACTPTDCVIAAGLAEGQRVAL